MQDRRDTPRLRLAYPIEVRSGRDDGESLGTSVTWNVSATGAYFGTFHGERFSVGDSYGVVISVPHRPAAGGPELVLGLRATGRVVRVDGPERHRRFGEGDLPLSGVALAFEGALDFRYGWD